MTTAIFCIHFSSLVWPCFSSLQVFHSSSSGECEIWTRCIPSGPQEPPGPPGAPGPPAARGLPRGVRQSPRGLSTFPTRFSARLISVGHRMSHAPQSWLARKPVGQDQRFPSFAQDHNQSKNLVLFAPPPHGEVVTTGKLPGWSVQPNF